MSQLNRLAPNFTLISSRIPYYYLHLLCCISKLTSTLCCTLVMIFSYIVRESQSWDSIGPRCSAFCKAKRNFVKRASFFPCPALLCPLKRNENNPDKDNDEGSVNQHDGENVIHTVAEDPPCCTHQFSGSIYADVINLLNK